MASGGEDPTLLQVLMGAVGKVLGAVVVGLGTLVGMMYRRLDMRVQTNDERLRHVGERQDNIEERIRNAPSREEMDRKLNQIHDDIRGVHTRLDRIIETRDRE
jgi:hypothetical protein